MTVRIDLPWSRPPLTANQRMHWAEKARVTKDVRRVASLLAAKAPRAEKVVITLHYQPKDKRRRDSVNLAPLLKALVDGVVLDAGLAPDDDTEHVSTPEPVIHEPAGVSALWLELDYPNGVRA